MSEIKVNKISPRSGTDVQLGDSGDTITVPTGATLDASNSTVTLPDGTVTNAKVNASAAIDYSKLNLTGNIALADLSATGTKDATTFLRGDNSFQEVPAGGITEADQWRLTTDFTGSSVLTANLERVDNAGFGKIGTGMTESSGIFTFPSTGVWLITFNVNFISTASIRQFSGRILTTTDNSSYTHVSRNFTNTYNFSTEHHTSIETKIIFDCTNTTTHKVKFDVNIDGDSSSVTTDGNTDLNYTYMTFIRLGDT
jgi:hypothetical protein